MAAQAQQVNIIRSDRNKQLGQLRPANTSAASIYSPGANVITRVDSIYVCNTTASLAKFRIFVDADGTTYSEATALFYDIGVAGNTTFLIEGPIHLSNQSGNMAVRTDTGNALTFTVYGVERT